MKCPKCGVENDHGTRFCGGCGTSLSIDPDSFTRTMNMPHRDFASGDLFAERYRIIKEIGRGGMGRVFEASDTRLKRRVALKFLSPVLTENAEAKDRFLREAQAAAALNHPRICTVFEIDDFDGQPYISMEFIEGMSLKDRLSRGLMDLHSVLDVVRQVASGLKEAHSKGVIHRDIKPANIMIDRKGHVKITDFGLAKLDEGGRLTKIAVVMGTPPYMSPEQARGEETDHRTDIWALGCVFFEMLSGRILFGREESHAVLYAILHNDVPPLSGLRPDIPKGIESILRKCLEKSKTNRYQKMETLLSDLRTAEEILTRGSQKSSDRTENPPSIAVLPFTNMSADIENEYFSDGLSEELINGLTKIQGMHVVARTSSFAFKGQNVDVRTIGKKLDVVHVLEGSVRKSGNRLRITAQLINIETGYHLWSERYDRELEDVFEVQDEITGHILSKLKTGFKTAVPSSQVHTSINPEAYDLYLKGRYNWNRQSVDKALDFYQQSLRTDPQFALAYAAVAEAYVMLSIGFDLIPSRDAFPKAEAAAQKALELDPGMAEAHVSLALVATFFGWDHLAAKKHFDKALELNPSLAAAYMWSEMYFSFLLGDFDKALERIKKAEELDPLNLLVKLRHGYVYVYRRENDKAIDYFKKLVELDPSLPMCHHALMDAYGQNREYDSAILEGEKMLELGGKGTAHLGVLGYYCGLAGQRERALELLDVLKAKSEEGYQSSFWVAAIYYTIGDLDTAFQWFEKAYEEREGNLIYITTPPQFDSLRADPRFAKLLRKMKLDHLL